MCSPPGWPASPIGSMRSARRSRELTAEIFGRESVGVVFGWIFAAHMAGAAVAAWGAGAARTWFGGYGWAFGTSGLLCLFAVGLVTQIRRGPELTAPVLVPA